MEKDELKHVGIPGMHWGVRRGSNTPSSGGGRKFQAKSLAKNMDGRKVNKLFGKRNRTSTRNYFLGNPKKFLKEMPVVNKKFKNLSKEDKKVWEKRTSKTLAVVSVISMAAIAKMILIP
jgi:hypothetical protein